MIRVRGLTKRFGDLAAVDGLDLTVEAGEVVALLGPNGAGKTTALRMISGILRPDGGTVEVAGHDLDEEPMAARTSLGFVPDRPFVYKKLTGREFLRFVAGLHGRTGPSVQERVRELIGFWELEEWADRLLESYSHGMRQKILISAALVHEPRALVVDEPIVGLDPRAARALKELLREFVEDGGAALISTHTLEFARAMAHRLAVVDGGRLVAVGTAGELADRAESESGDLEEIFLRLTGGPAERELARFLE